MAVTENEQFLCFRQTKYGAEGISLAPVAGMLEPDEAPLDGAKRELLEEVGYESTSWVNLGSQVMDPNRGVATVHLFLALNARKVTEPRNDDLEDQELVFLNRDEIGQALMAGEFKFLPWLAVVAMSLNYLYMPRHQ
jgi:ADP-ribose pyrophosphatase YjhB (NUDIX family)